MQANFSPVVSLSTPDDSTTDPTSGIDSTCMTKAALYARVSTDSQQKEGTIESQLVELKRQITAAGHVPTVTAAHGWIDPHSIRCGRM
jgi:hypothetical protein